MCGHLTYLEELDWYEWNKSLQQVQHRVKRGTLTGHQQLVLTYSSIHILLAMNFTALVSGPSCKEVAFFFFFRSINTTNEAVSKVSIRRKVSRGQRSASLLITTAIYNVRKHTVTFQDAVFPRGRVNGELRRPSERESSRPD